MGWIHISVITLGELLTWALREKSSPQRLQGIKILLGDLSVLDITEEIAWKFGELRAGLLVAGRPTPEMDLWIAATAIVHGFTVVTHNVQDFAHLLRLNIEDWLSP